jgi:hypothetical protein
MLNATALAWLGYTPEELIGHSVNAVLTEESQRNFQKYFPVFKQRGWTRDSELDMVRTAPFFPCC